MSKEPEVDNVFDVSQSHAYTYEVTMVIQIVAPNRTVADAKLDQDGGYISKREVKFIKSTLLYGDETSTEEE
jgi:hypothetical protein